MQRTWTTTKHAALAGTMWLLAAGSAQADPYTDSATAACEHVKGCALAQMGEIPPEMRPMIEASLGNMCVQMQQPQSYAGFSQKHPLYQPATECMRSISALSCEALTSGDGETPACKRLNEAAEAYDSNN